MKTQLPQWSVFVAFAGWLVTLCALTMSSLAGAANSSTADHSQFKELQQPFASGPDVTKACLTCHTEAAKQVHLTKHWTWEFLNPENNQRLGKKNVLNNFCISISQNYAFCTSCHTGYGWKDKNFDFSRKTMSTAWSATIPPEITVSRPAWLDTRYTRKWNCPSAPARSSGR